MNERKLSINDIQQLVEKNPLCKLWVVNKTKGNSKGPCFFMLENPTTGKADPIIIPDTWLPIDLTSLAPIDHLLKSVTFRRIITLNMINIISENYANELFMIDGAKEEMERLEKENGMSINITTQDNEPKEDPGATTRVITLIERLTTTDMREIDAINKIRNWDDPTMDEIRYVFNQTKQYEASHDDISYKKLRAYCKKLKEEVI